MYFVFCVLYTFAFCSCSSFYHGKRINIYVDFQKYDPPSFDGGKVDPVAVEAWLEPIEKVFQYMNCLEESTVSYML